MSRKFDNNGKFRKMTESEILDEFNSNYEIVTESGCWIWTGCKVKAGYGTIGKSYMHRYSYELHQGRIPDGMHVCHQCDMPDCVNPDHLFIGTHRDNHEDKISKGRSSGGSMKGEDHPSVKLSEADIINIRAIYKYCNISQTRLSNIYKMSQSHISSIISGKSWGHI